MSGASAMAAARRRRAGAQEQIQGSQQINKQVTIQENIIQENNNQLTPLQILKMHDTKIKNLEELLNEKIDNNISMNSKSNEDINIDLLTKKMEDLVTNKLNNINDTIKSMLLNIEKLSNNVKINEKNLNKTEEFTNELNALKMLVIKNQTLSLETNNDIIKMKDELNEIKHSINDDNNNDLTHTNDILKSMFNRFSDNDNDNENENIFSKINIEDNDEDDIMLKNIENLDITITGIEDLNEIRKNIECELIEKKGETTNDNSEEIKIDEIIN